MKVSGFFIVRHGTKFDYPYLESLRSVLPVVDELVINVGIGEDSTLAEIQKFAREEGQGKVMIFESHWPLDDPEKRKGGKILSEQTNLALDRCTGDWCIYIQADEVLHEEDYPALKQALAEAQLRPEVDGLLFDYRHLYGSFDVIQESRSAYRREVRAIRRSSGARSVGDAQSFRLADGSKPCVILSGARIFHYGWVRTPEAMKEKTTFMDTLYHGAQSAGSGPATGNNYQYKRFWGLKRFKETHPAVMRERIRVRNWSWDLENSPMNLGKKDLTKIPLDFFETLTGIRLFEYRSYRLVAR